MRVKIRDDENKIYSTVDMPCRFNKGDFLDLSNVVYEGDVTEEQYVIIYELSYHVESISFDRDYRGIFQTAWVIGE